MATAAVSVVTTRGQCFTAGWCQIIFWCFIFIIINRKVSFTFPLQWTPHLIFIRRGYLDIIFIRLFERIKFVDETFPTCRIINQWSRMKVGQCLKRVKAFVKLIPAGSFSCLRMMSGLMCACAVYLQLTGASASWLSGFSALQVSFPASHLIDMLIKCVNQLRSTLLTVFACQHTLLIDNQSAQEATLTHGAWPSSGERI